MLFLSPTTYLTVATVSPKAQVITLHLMLFLYLPQPRRLCDTQRLFIHLLVCLLSVLHK